MLWYYDLVQEVIFTHLNAGAEATVGATMFFSMLVAGVLILNMEDIEDTGFGLVGGGLMGTAIGI